MRHRIESIQKRLNRVDGRQICACRLLQRENPSKNLRSFKSFEELQKEMADYLKRSNQIPSKAIGWMSPIEKCKQLFEKQPLLTAPDLPKAIMNFLYENGA